MKKTAAKRTLMRITACLTVLTVISCPSFQPNVNGGTSILQRDKTWEFTTQERSEPATISIEGPPEGEIVWRINLRSKTFKASLLVGESSGTIIIYGIAASHGVLLLEKPLTFLPLQSSQRESWEDQSSIAGASDSVVRIRGSSVEEKIPSGNGVMIANRVAITTSQGESEVPYMTFWFKDWLDIVRYEGVAGHSNEVWRAK